MSLPALNDEFLAAASLCLQDSGNLMLKHASPTSWVPWVSVDPFPRDSELQKAQAQCPRYFEGPPVFECTVGAGELLYLYVANYIFISLVGVWSFSVCLCYKREGSLVEYVRGQLLVLKLHGLLILSCNPAPTKYCELPNWGSKVH